MKKTLLLTFVMLTISTINFAQEAINITPNQTDSIELKKIFGGYQFYQNDKLLKFKQLDNLIKSNNEAYDQFKSSKSSRTIATILGYAGGFMIGWPLGTAIAGGKPNWVIAGAGAGLTAISIPISINSNKKLKKAVSIYNSTMQH